MKKVERKIDYWAFFLQPVMLILGNTMKSKNGKNPTWILK
jgi:hypothetical protein